VTERGSSQQFLERARDRLTPPWSLATRLAVGFSAASCLLLLVTAAFPYFALQYNLNREDNESLVQKVASVADIISQHASGVAATQSFDELQLAVGLESSEPIYVRVLRLPVGQVVAETQGMAQLLPPDQFDSPTTYPFDSKVGPPLVDRHVPKHHAMRLMSALLRGKSGAGDLVVQVALDRTPESELMEIYGNSLLVLLGLGLLAAAIAGYAIAWRGLRPVRRMASAVAKIGSSNLHERLDVQHVPAELASLATAFNSMLSRLQEGFGRLSQFSSDIAHELRTPVNNVRGLVELTLSQADRPANERAEQLEKALDECQRLSKLIDNLLFVARSENPQTQIQRQELDLSQELKAICEFYEPSASEAGIHLQVESTTPVQASVNRILLQRAVANLLENAIAHTPQGGTILLSSAAESDVAVLRVSDTGPGIPPEHLSRIFDRFHRGDESRSKNTGGIGLGLAIVRSIAVMHGGSVEVANRASGGAEFTVRFPTAVASGSR
jgi:two-component system heavy metal sensor histidine kinase CusS